MGDGVPSPVPSSSTRTPCWFDYRRGVAQGRCFPTLTPPHGTKIFVLGEEEEGEITILTTGDWTSVSQIVDLTGYDFVCATMDTKGRPCGSGRAAPRWTPDTDELWSFNFDVPGPRTPNLVIPAGNEEGFALESVGQIIYPRESYTGEDTFCRGIPPYSDPQASLVGVHTPPCAVPMSKLHAYTLQMWVNLDIDSLPGSTGRDFDLLRFYSEVGGARYGIFFSMYGVGGPGAHEWYGYLTHYDEPMASGMSVDAAYTISTNPGWQLITITFDDALPLAQRVKVFIDDAPPVLVGIGIADGPAVPEADVLALQYGSFWAFGQYDSCRLLRRALTTLEVSASYTQSKTPGPMVNHAWVQEILVDRIVYASRRIVTNERRRWWDFVAPVRKLDGQHEIAFRMRLEAA